MEGPSVTVTDPFKDAMELDGEFYGENGDKILFTAGNISNPSADLAREQVWKDIEALDYYDSQKLLTRTSYSAQDMFSDPSEDATISSVVVALSAMGDDDESEGDEDKVSSMVNASREDDSRWAPHGSKTMFFLDLLDNLPRLRLSDDHLQAIMWVM
ncbi:hypothetical protein GALMADRAFT_120313, partial [Galerina marginata CBS 339.88]